CVILCEDAEPISESHRRRPPSLVPLVADPDSRRVRHCEGEATESRDGDSSRQSKRAGEDRSRGEASLHSAFREPFAVTPGCELRPQRFPDTNEGDAVAEFSESNVFG